MNSKATSLIYVQKVKTPSAGSLAYFSLGNLLSVIISSISRSKVDLPLANLERLDGFDDDLRSRHSLTNLYHFPFLNGSFPDIFSSSYGPFPVLILKYYFKVAAPVLMAQSAI